MKENILDNYALKRLSASDKTLLQKALSSDPNFQQELDFHCDIIKGIETHMEQLFDAALVDVLVYADQDLKNIIQQADIELESENFFQTKSSKPIETIVEKVPVIEPYTDPNNFDSFEQNKIILPEKEETISNQPNQVTAEKAAPKTTLPANKEAEKDASFSASIITIIVILLIILSLLKWYYM